VSYGVRVQVSSTAPCGGVTKVSVAPKLFVSILKLILIERHQTLLKMYKITIHKENNSVCLNFADKILIEEAIRKSGYDFDFPCSGNGLCGKCKVLAYGDLSKPNSDELRLNLEPNMRLACQTWAVGNCDIYIQFDDRLEIVSTLPAQSIPNNHLKAGPNSFGIAVDIGTTTIAAGVFCSGSPHPIVTASERNKQTEFGADVISRINYTVEKGTKPLAELIRSQLHQIFEMMLTQAGIQFDQIVEVVITGNSTMLHILNGFDPRSLSHAPFEMVSHFDFDISAQKLFPSFNKETKLYFPPCIGAFIGADVACAVLSTSLHKSEQKSILVDIGTNGEIIFSNRKQLFCCSCAAGPAFEGVGLSMGMPAKSGAVSNVFVDNGHLKYETINQKEALGICGSGVIACLARLIENQIIDDTGRLKKDCHDFIELIEGPDENLRFRIGNSNVYIDQRDIRNIQLAKAAIAAGIDTLLEECGVRLADVRRLILCGGFGSSFDRRDAAIIGLFPKELAESVVTAGNAAFGGAALLLFSECQKRNIRNIAKNACEISLSSNSFFMEQFIEKISFEVD
jgi:uncharacterized 2Fe-2S/4Fe-4S cluster protein (DUF4445 family)